ncbi:SDR family NAD(P)-dependent oxidoreductase [Endobacterium cereale]|uniref:SDR family NAD(P)-dependent oxidoreductase n=1 Tax=Endobacterium cereale TaxID=2663029 RepID=UPI002B46A577|nr:SDR family NAD(P)-dependent oxidoreductase [Endobacterium cereale]MEB2848548.1 SDR family NAD(P)-dependent oxidoreductase [Endobacterium cereale]
MQGQDDRSGHRGKQGTWKAGRQGADPHGYTVLVGSRALSNGQTAAEDIGQGAVTIQFDVTDPQSMATAAKRITADFGRLDLLVNNAGIGQSARYQSGEEVIAASVASVAPLDEVHAVFETNVFGVLAVTQALLPLIRKSSAGRIVNVSSGVASLALNSDPNFPFRSSDGVTYSASKTALNAITVALAIELEGAGIKRRAAGPSYTATAISDFQGTDEVGARPLVLAALDTESPTGSFTGPDMADSKSPNEVLGNVAIITGAASGIGRAIAELFIERGAKVVAVDQDATVNRMASASLAPLVADVTIDGCAEKAVAIATERLGNLDILVNNAGYINYQPVVETTQEDWKKVMTINATGYFLFSREAAKAMLPNRKGAIVNIASYASFFAFQVYRPYAASKGTVA